MKDTLRRIAPVEACGGCHGRKLVGLHKGIGSANQAAGALCFVGLGIATQAYLRWSSEKGACTHFQTFLDGH